MYNPFDTYVNLADEQLKKHLDDRQRESANAWDRFLDKHQTELENLRRVSNERKKQIANMNQQISELSMDNQQLRHQVAGLKTSYQQNQNPMLEVRQAHQEADQWQCRYEEAQEKLEAVTALLNRFNQHLYFMSDDISETLGDGDIDEPSYMRPEEYVTDEMAEAVIKSPPIPVLDEINEEDIKHVMIQDNWGTFSPVSDEPITQPGFADELEHLLNKHGIDSRMGVPDFELADMLLDRLQQHRDVDSYSEDRLIYSSELGWVRQND